MYLVGFGQDSHRLEKSQKKDNPLFLGGLSFTCGLTAIANSDGDVILHAICNAISTALGGTSFSQVADPLCQQGITDSKEYLAKFVAMMQQKSYQIKNMSISVEALQPKLEKYSQHLKNSLAKLLQVSPEQVGIAFTTGEGLTAYGQGEGISCTAIVLLQHL